MPINGSFRGNFSLNDQSNSRGRESMDPLRARHGPGGLILLLGIALTANAAPILQVLPGLRRESSSLSTENSPVGGNHEVSRGLRRRHEAAFLGLVPEAKFQKSTVRQEGLMGSLGEMVLSPFLDAASGLVNTLRGLADIVVQKLSHPAMDTSGAKVSASLALVSLKFACKSCTNCNLQSLGMIFARACFCAKCKQRIM